MKKHRQRAKYESAFKAAHFVPKSALATFWQPTKEMKLAGFRSVPLGRDGPQAWQLAIEWENRWQAVRRGEAPAPAMVLADNLSPEKSEELTIYPARSIGEAFRRYRGMHEWERKAPR